MNHYAFVPLVSFSAYMVLAAITLRQSPRRKLHRVFTLYLLAIALWGVLAFLILANFFPQGFVLLSKLLLISGLWMVVNYYHFIRAFLNKPGGNGLILGYGCLGGVILLTGAGYVVRAFSQANGVTFPIFSTPVFFVLGLWASALLGSAVLDLVREYRRSEDHLTRNRIAYLLGGFALMTAFGLTKLHPTLGRYHLAHFGNLGNAALISYAIMKYQLLDIKLVLRKGLVYSAVTVTISAIYILLLFLISTHLHDWVESASIAGLVAAALILAGVSNQIRAVIQKGVDRLFYKGSYDYRQLVLNFSQRMKNVLDSAELAEAMLQPIARAVGAKQVALLLPREGRFVSQFAHRLRENEPVVHISLGRESAIVTWLAKNGRPLSREMIAVGPEFKGLWEAEKQVLTAGAVELLCPLRTKNSLVAILALSRKASGVSLSTDDTDLLVTLADQAAAVLENAELYARAQERAHTDELTGLFNHRYFQERLDEEIGRGSRFGEVFSLLYLDIDLFKAYNDIHGHLAGDAVLREVCQHIKGSIRSIDIACRYGGEEFTVILPGASVIDAFRVAERIRKRVESVMDARGISPTCSIGVACWPTDGLMREELIHSADRALYLAKALGRNRTCLYSEATSSRTNRLAQPLAGQGILSTIYALAATVDAKDHYTYGHSKKVGKYASALGEALGLPADRVATLRAAALLHDIGKLGIPDGILLKPGPLARDEWEPVRAHPKLGTAILKNVAELAACLPAIQHHHESYDGGGYPAGLRGNHIPLDARILAIADAYDAMTSLRPYRVGKLTHEEAVQELRLNVGTQFDPELVAVFVSLDVRTAPETAHVP